MASPAMPSTRSVCSPAPSFTFSVRVTSAPDGNTVTASIFDGAGMYAASATLPAGAESANKIASLRMTSQFLLRSFGKAPQKKCSGKDGRRLLAAWRKVD